MINLQAVPSEASIFVAGHRGLVGSALLRALHEAGYTNILTAGRDELDLRHQSEVNKWFASNRPEYVYLVAGKVGGVGANSNFPADFLYDNMMIHGTVVHAAHLTNVKKLLYLGSSCIYPRLSSQPIAEDQLLTGLLEPTNEGYAIAKIAGIKLCEMYRRQYGHDFISAMPTNLYGPGDNFDLEASHVIPALIRKFHEAKKANNPAVEIWGTGKAMREFLHVDDLASACLFLMDHYSEDQHVNVGTGIDQAIGDLALLIRDVVYPEADLIFDTSKPDGMPRKVLDISKIEALGWKPTIELRNGLEASYQWFVDNYDRARGTAGQQEVSN